MIEEQIDHKHGQKTIERVAVGDASADLLPEALRKGFP